MSREATITTAQLRTLYLNTELGGNTRHLNHFSYAEKGTSAYSFGLLQFDVGNDTGTRSFLEANGFTADDIDQLSRRGGLTREQLAALDAKLQAIPQERVDAFTDRRLERIIERVDEGIDRVRAINPAAADAIARNPELQLAMADYDNQFGSMGRQFVSYLAGEEVTLRGGTIRAGNPPTQDDVQRFIDSTKYGVENPAAAQSREERFDRAIGQLGIQQGGGDQRQPTQQPGGGAPARPAGSGTWPAPGNQVINQADRPGEGRGEWNTRRPAHRDGDGHDGIDIQGRVGDPIVAFRGGTARAYSSPSAGNFIVIDHGDGSSSRYMHLDTMRVRPGQSFEVREGEQIGTMGRTGNVPRQGDTHLHFEYRINGRDVDPMPHLGRDRQAGAADAAAPERGAPAAQPASRAMADGVLKAGDRGPEVVALQERLNALGYRGSDGRPLETRSGIYGPQTEHALRDFQRAHGLQVDGKAGARETLPALERAGGTPLVSEATHPNHALYTEVGRRIAEQTGRAPTPQATANVTLQMLENGIRSPQDIQGLAVRGSDVHVQGPVPGMRVSVDLQAPTADMQAMSDHMARQSEEQLRLERQRQQAPSPVMAA